MIRTQIYLPEKMHMDLRFMAKMKGVSVSELVRQYLNEKIVIEKTKKLSIGEAMAQIRIKGTKKDRYVSRDIDKILYG